MKQLLYTLAFLATLSVVPLARKLALAQPFLTVFNLFNAFSRCKRMDFKCSGAFHQPCLDLRKPWMATDGQDDGEEGWLHSFYFCEPLLWRRTRNLLKFRYEQTLLHALRCKYKFKGFADKLTYHFSSHLITKLHAPRSTLRLLK